MTITAPTSPAAEQAVFGAVAASADRSWITTTDHRRIGQLHFGFVLGALAVAGALGFVVHGTVGGWFDQGERGRTTLLALLSGHEMAFTGLIALPIWMAAATMFVPGLIGAGRLAFPRLQSLVLWTWVVSAAVMASAFLVEDSPVGFIPTSAQPLTAQGPANRATELAIGSLMLAMIAMSLGAANIIATVVTERRAGLRFGSIRPFAWGSFVASVIVVISAPVALGGLFVTYIDQHWGATLLSEPGALRMWAHAVWAWGRPDAFVLPIVAVAAFAEVIVSRSGKPLINPAVANGLLGLAGALTFTTWTGMEYKLSAISAPATRPWTALVFLPLALVTLMALAGGRGIKPSPSLLAIGAPLVMAVGGLLIAYAATTDVTDAGIFQMGSANALVLGGGIIAMAALVAELGGHVYKRSLPTLLVGLALLLLIVGGLAHAVGPALAATTDDTSAAENLHLLAALGKAALAGGAAVMLLAILSSNGRPTSATAAHEEAH
jgi:cytochrome c oxidase subunit I